MSPYGEIGLILIIFAETGLLIGFFLPGDSLLFTAGLLANQGKLNLAAVLIGCFVAAVIGDQVGFTVGDKLGPRFLSKPDSKLFKREYVERTEAFFDKHGPKTIVIARFVPVVRTFAPVLAGVGNMSRRTFLAYNVVGAFIWVFGVTMAGYLLADVIGDSDRQVPPADHLPDHRGVADPALPRVAQGQEGRPEARSATPRPRPRPPASTTTSTTPDPLLFHEPASIKPIVRRD